MKRSLLISLLAAAVVLAVAAVFLFKPRSRPATDGDKRPGTATNPRDSVKQQPPPSQPDKADPADRIIEPATRVGPITRSSSEQDVIAMFGKANVVATDIQVGEGETVPGTTVFAGTANEMEIEWKNDRKNPERITFRQKGSQWKTAEGIAVGMPIDEVARINGRPFLITGFEWDYAGRSISWEGGKLPKELQIDFDPTKEVSATEYEKVIGSEGKFSSSHQVISTMGLVVEAIFVRWDEE